MSFLQDQYFVEDGPGFHRPENEGGLLKSYFITGRKNGLAAYKPWQKEGDANKQSITSLHEAVRGHSDSMANVLDGLDPDTKKKIQAAHKSPVVDHEAVTFGIRSSSNGINLMSDSIEKDFLSKHSLSPSTSPTRGHNLQKQLVKTPLPYPRLSATFNFTYGMTLNEALMRDAMRASNDNQLVKLMHEKKIQKEYFFNPPLHWWSLNFLDEEKKDERKSYANEIEMDENYNSRIRKDQHRIEAKYRDEGFKGFKLNPKVTTFASPKLHFLFDVITSAFTLIVLVVSSILFFYKDFPLSLMIVIPVCALAMLGMLLYQCFRFSPTKFPRKISRCATAQAEKENSDTGMS